MPCDAQAFEREDCSGSHNSKQRQVATLSTLRHCVIVSPVSISSSITAFGMMTPLISAQLSEICWWHSAGAIYLFSTLYSTFGSVDGNGGTEDDGSAVGASDGAPCIDLEGDDLVRILIQCVSPFEQLT